MKNGSPVAFGLALLSLFVGFPSALTAAPTVPPTTVHTFSPPHPSGSPKNGNCWTTSLASNRPDAYRCMIGNDIYDPCFQSKSKQFVECDANPAKRQAGFAVHLEKPLPAAQKPKGAILPFLVQLRDGTLCTPETGTRTLVGTTIVAWNCAEKVQATGTYVGLGNAIDMKSPIWMARRVVYRAGSKGAELVSDSLVQVAAAWK